MAGRKVDDEPEFGAPAERVPATRTDRAPSQYWSKVAAHAKKNPGMWIPLVNSPLSYSRLKNIALVMRTQPGGRRTPVALREPGMQTLISDKQLWFRYDPPKADLVDALRKDLAHISPRRFA